MKMTSYEHDYFQYKPFMADFPYRTIVKRDLLQIRNNPHPTYVKHVKGFLGQPTQLVRTEMDDFVLLQSTIEGYIQDSIKKGSWNYNSNSKQIMKKSKNLDEIISLQYFTGLQNFSFKENYLPYLGYREYFSDWRKNLRSLTVNAYQPILVTGEVTNKTKDYLHATSQQNSYEWNNKNADNSRCKSMYTASGRLSTCQDFERKLMSRQKLRTQQRLTTGLVNKSNECEGPDLNNLDASVFILLANILQTASPHVVQNWLSQSTEREKALMISMIQTVLLNQNSNQSLHPNGSLEKGTQTYKYTPNLSSDNDKFDSKEKSKKVNEKCDILVLENNVIDELPIEKSNEIRPPTSSTFRSNKNKNCLIDSNTSKRNSNSTMWNQKKSLKNSS